MTTSSRRALVVTGVSLLAWLTWNQLRPFHHPWGDLSNGNYTDHLSHMNAARALPRVGLDLWRKPVEVLARAPTPAEWRDFPADVHPGGRWTGGVYMLDGWPADKPWVTSSVHQPRLYPPGDLLLVAPVALAYHFTGLSLTEANRWLYALFLVYAHLALFLIFETALRQPLRPLLAVATLAAYVMIIFWTLQGFYDPAALFPLLLCARWIEARRERDAAVSYCVAAAVHFRTFFLAPWAVLPGWRFVRERKWRQLGLRDLGPIALGAVCAALSLGAFALVSSAIGRQQINNPVHLGVAAAHPVRFILFLAVVLAAGALLTRARAWLDLATLAWLALMVLFVREAHEWHLLIPMAWLVAPVTLDGERGRRDEWVRSARLMVLAYLQAAVMVN